MDVDGGGGATVVNSAVVGVVAVGQFWHVGAARKKADRKARAEAGRRLLQKLFPSDSAVFESKRWSRPEKRHDGGSFPWPRLL
jgi:hypothetical protein